MNFVRKCLLAAGLAGALAASPAQAVDFSFTGSFTRDDDVQLFNFSVGASSTVTLRTWSYAGGTNAAGAVIPRGGFDPILALFDSAGALVGQNDDGSNTQVPADVATGVNYDTYLEVLLPAGSYTVAVMEYDNFAVGPALANGFTRSGQGNFTGSFTCGSSQQSFRDVSQTAACGRNANWAFDILNVNQAQVVSAPEPGTLAVLGMGLLGLAGLCRRRR